MFKCFKRFFNIWLCIIRQSTHLFLDQSLLARNTWVKAIIWPDWVRLSTKVPKIGRNNHLKFFSHPLFSLKSSFYVNIPCAIAYCSYIGMNTCLQFLYNVIVKIEAWRSIKIYKFQFGVYPNFATKRNSV